MCWSNWACKKQSKKCLSKHKNQHLSEEVLFPPLHSQTLMVRYVMPAHYFLPTIMHRHLHFWFPMCTCKHMKEEFPKLHLGLSVY